MHLVRSQYGKANMLMMLMVLMMLMIITMIISKRGIIVGLAGLRSQWDVHHRLDFPYCVNINEIVLDGDLMTYCNGHF